MQFDTYHVFTVDEHTIERCAFSIRWSAASLPTWRRSPAASSRTCNPARSLYMAMLLHDVAKGRGGDHSTLGAEVAAQVCPLLGLSAEETETVSWLVLHHLLLSQTAFKRDIDDPKTIFDVAETIQSPERLKLLLVLTVADMRAVSPRVWNGWKATLLREIYARVAEVLAGGLLHQRTRRQGEAGARRGRRNARRPGLERRGPRLVPRPGPIPATGCRSILTPTSVTPAWYATPSRAVRRSPSRPSRCMPARSPK